MNLLNLGIKLYLNKIQHPKAYIYIYIYIYIIYIYSKNDDSFLWHLTSIYVPLTFLCQAMKKWNEEQGMKDCEGWIIYYKENS